MVSGGAEVVSEPTNCATASADSWASITMRPSLPPTCAGIVPVPVAGRVFDKQELELLVDSSLDFWLTTGRFAEQFEREFAKFVGVREAVLVNSGSSANLLAVTA